MARLAWFAPPPSSWPGCTCQSAALASCLEASHSIDWYRDLEAGGASCDRPDVEDAHDFVWKNLHAPYDLTVYELGDSVDHAFIWPYLVRYPGLVILHDGRLHDSRGWSLLKQVRIDDYGAEFGFNHPGVNDNVPRLAHAELLGLTRELWPMRRVVSESCRLLLAPNAWVADEIRQEASHDRVEVVEPGVYEPAIGTDARRISRQRYGIEDDTVVFATFGSISPRSRTPQILSAFARLDARTPQTRLLLCGMTADGYDVEADIERLGIQHRVTLAGRLDGQETTDHLAAADVCFCLQWPDRSDGMQMWITALAAGLPTVVTDLADRVDVPALDPRNWSPRGENPACVSVDMVDEEPLIELAMQRLAQSDRLRAKLAERGRELWRSRFTADRLTEQIDQAVTRTLSIPAEAVRASELPAHLLASGTDEARSRLEGVGGDAWWRGEGFLKYALFLCQ